MTSVVANSPWAIRGTVVHGHGRGGTLLGFPTANIDLNASITEALAPMSNHVFYGFGIVEGLQETKESDASATAAAAPVYPLVMSVGFNPHFKDKALTVEAHFLHTFPADFYGATVRVVSCGPLREMSAFTTLEALIETINGDCVTGRKLLETSAEAWSRCRFLNAATPATGTIPMLHTAITMDTVL